MTDIAADGHERDATAPDVVVVEQPDSSRFELQRSGELMSFATYRSRGDAVVVPHVETVAKHRGQGCADRLLDGIVEILRREGRTIVPMCWFASDYFRSRPQQRDVLEPAGPTR